MYFSTRTCAAAVLAAVLAAVTPAQSSNVRNTGCPNAPYSTITAARIGQPVTINIAGISATTVPFLSIGYMSGRNITFNRPFTCVDGCNYYPAALLVTPLPMGTRQVRFTVPNDRTLLQTCWAFQTAGVDLGKNCLDLHGAVSFCVGR